MKARYGKLLIAVLAVALGLGLAGEARAQGVYLGGAYSWATLHADDVDANLLDDNASAYKLFLGYEFPQILGLEAGWTHFGSYDVGNFEGFEDLTGEVDATGWTAALTARIPIGSLVTVYGKAGYFFWNSELDIPGDIGDVFGELKEDGQDPFFGAGIRLNLGQVSILGEYERYSSSEDFDFDLFSLGVRLTF